MNKAVFCRAFPIVVLWSASLQAGPIWSHPNVQVALPEPTVSIGLIALSPSLLELEFPQNVIWYTGGLVGYFANEWRAPIWSTPNYRPLEDEETAVLPVFNRPNVVPPGWKEYYTPPETNPYIVPETQDPPVIPVNPPVIPVNPPVVPPVNPPVVPPVIVTIPEPGFLTVWPVAALLGWGAWRRRNR
ncbi:MAG: hypothetical protein JNM66_12090 [Bryobacterales bacterium]|nr:hypothetical protein [Bryobacterales bacterium]